MNLEDSVVENAATRILFGNCESEYIMCILFQLFWFLDSALSVHMPSVGRKMWPGSKQGEGCWK